MLRRYLTGSVSLCLLYQVTLIADLWRKVVSMSYLLHSTELR